MTSSRRRPTRAVACGWPAVLAIGAALAAGCGGARPVTTPSTPATIPSAGSPPASTSTPTGTTVVSPAVSRLRTAIDSVLDAPLLERGTWGVVVTSLRTGEVLYARNPRRLLSPASNLKIVTLAATAETLGWDFTYDTTLLGVGRIDAGVLHGDLIVRGTGDPSLIEDQGMAAGVFAAWAERLTSLGIHAISGRVIGDDNAFDDDTYGSGWMYDDMNEGYSAGVGPLQFNMGETAVTVAPATSLGGAATVSIATDGSGLVLRNRVSTVAAGEAPRLGTKRIANTNVLEVFGSIPLGSQPIQQRVAVDNQTLYFASELRKALVAHGIAISGAAVDIDDLPVAPRTDGAVALASYKSPPLSALADTLMKLSQNQYAETFTKTLGAHAGTPTFEAGRRVIGDVMRGWGIDSTQLLQADGSGLSRYDMVSAEALAGVLAHVAHDARLEGPFKASLVVAGTPGMMANRLKNTAAAGKVQAKTGSMRHVRATSGYTQTADGEPVVFSIIANNFGISSADVDRTADAVILKVFEFTR